MAIDIELKNTATGEIRIESCGFSWTSFFFMFFVPLFRGDFVFFSLFVFCYFALGALTAGLGVIPVWLVQMFGYNKMYIKRLLEKGFRPHGEGSQKTLLEVYGIKYETKA